jgi:hypothetical protein
VESVLNFHHERDQPGSQVAAAGKPFSEGEKPLPYAPDRHWPSPKIARRRGTFGLLLQRLDFFPDAPTRVPLTFSGLWHGEGDQDRIEEPSQFRQKFAERWGRGGGGVTAQEARP